jgi:glutamate--cysteine ligase
MMMTLEAYREHQVAFFKQNAVQKPELLGMEFEHFLIDETNLRSYDYTEPEGQRDFLNKLCLKGWRVFSEEEGQPLGIVKEGHTITLEPGGQVEISLSPFSTIEAIDQAYQEVLKDMASVLIKGQRIVSVGYHPQTKIDDLSLLPKKRYDMMYNYFKNNGQFCHNMMKGTAATQVSIDYSDEEDFIKKFRVANYLSPVLASLFDAVPVFEGNEEIEGNRRLRIWQETDLKRSKLIVGALSQRFDFEAYADYLLSLPPILIQSEGKIYETGDRRLSDLLQVFMFNEKDLEHLQSMVFPDVRLKKFIEIRMPDAMPYPYNLAVASIVKGILYNPENLKRFYEQSLAVDDIWVIKMNQRLMDSRLNDIIPELEGIKDLSIQAALAVLNPSDAEPLKVLNELNQKEGSMLKKLQKMRKEAPETYLDFITVAKFINKEGQQ